MVSGLEGFHCICLRVIIILCRVHLEPKLKNISPHSFSDLRMGTRICNQVLWETSVPFVTYQEEEEGSDSGVVPILELYQCLAAMPVCKPHS